MPVVGEEGGGVVRSLTWLDTGLIAWSDKRFKSLGGRGDIYIPMPVIGGGERWWCWCSGHSWVALSDRRFVS